jgi:protoheme IX farnesyltransferase
MSGLWYLAGALLLDAGFLYYAIRMQRDHDDRLAMKAFGYSIVYLGCLFLLLVADRYWYLYFPG